MRWRTCATSFAFLGLLVAGCDTGTGDGDADVSLCGNPSCLAWWVGDGECDPECSCSANQYDGGDCARQCTPDCEGRTCGEDSCGGLCGTCTGGDVCAYNGQCVPSSLGVVTGSLSFEARLLSANNDGTISLNDVQILPAVSMLALVIGPSGSLIGGAQLDGEGRFSIPVTQALQGGEIIVFAAAWAPRAESEQVSFAVLMPEAGGEPETTASSIWSWHADVPADGAVGDLQISKEQGSGAMFLFLIAAASMETILQDILYGDETGLVRLAFLWSPGVSWDCGSCFGPGYVQYLGDTSDSMDSSIWISDAAGDSSCWGYPVIMHEFGHYVARYYSRDDSPGGTHYVGQDVSPPFAWSEGFASFFAVSTFSRWVGEPIPYFWDIQQGSFFWHDYEAALYSSGDNIGMPSPSGGMTQDLDENAISVMLWHLWDGLDVPEGEDGDDGVAIGTSGVHGAIGSPRFVWDDRGAAGADFVDFLDAVLCTQPGDAATLVGIVNNWFGFPYDGQPVCP